MTQFPVNFPGVINWRVALNEFSDKAIYNIDQCID